MDSVISKSQPNQSLSQHHYADHSKQNQISLQSLRSCIEHITNLYKMCHLTPKQTPEQHGGILEFCTVVQKMLRKLVVLVPKHMVSLQLHNKLVKDHEIMNESYQTMLKDQKDYKCELNVLEGRLAQVQRREQLLREEKQRENRSSREFERKLIDARREYEHKLDKINTSVHHGDETLRVNRKKSLPTIINNNHLKHKMLNRNSLLLLVGNSPTEDEKTQRLVEHLRRKY